MKYAKKSFCRSNHNLKKIHSYLKNVLIVNLLEQRRMWMKVWKKERKKKEEKKASSPTSLRINTWVVFHSLYIENSFLHFSLPQLKSISSTFLSPSYISTDAFSANFSLFLSVALKISVGYKNDFLSHNFGWL